MDTPQRVSKKLTIVLVVAALVLVAVLLTAARLPENHKDKLIEKFGVTWEPGEIVVTTSPGERQTMPVSFTTRRTLKDVVVRIPQELQQVVQVEPSQFRKITKGETVHLNLIVSVPADASLGTIEGKIRLFRVLRLRHRTFSWPVLFAKPLPVTVNVWQSFVSDQGITVHYPPEYQAEITANSEGSTLDTWESLQNFKEGLPPSFTMVIRRIDLQGETLESFVTHTLGPLISINGVHRDVLEVFEPSIGEGLFHHFMYLTDEGILIDVIARTSNHDEDQDFLAILEALRL